MESKQGHLQWIDGKFIVGLLITRAKTFKSNEQQKIICNISLLVEEFQETVIFPLIEKE